MKIKLTARFKVFVMKRLAFIVKSSFSFIIRSGLEVSPCRSVDCPSAQTMQEMQA